MASVITFLPALPTNTQQHLLHSNSSTGLLRHTHICFTSTRHRRALPLRILCEVAVAEQTPARADVRSLKTNLLAAVAGLDRGLSAGDADVQMVDSAAGELEAVGRPVNLAEDLDLLQGRWRLIYSSAFASGSFGGRRPGPPVGRLPLTLGQVYQRIEVVAKELDNIVDLRIGTPWPLPPVEVTATLAHTFELIGVTDIKITFEKTSVKLGGGLSQSPPFVLPQLANFLRIPPALRSGDFQVTYLDSDMRVSRGDRGELRIFLSS